MPGPILPTADTPIQVGRIQENSATRDTPDVTKKNDKDKIQKKKNDPRKVAESNNKNILTKYRTYTYVFTLGVLKMKSINDPNQWEHDLKQHTILKSGGKGPNSIQGPGLDEIKTVEQKYKSKNKTAEKKIQAIRDQVATTSALVAGFDRLSAGHFDMFMDNVEIISTMAPGKANGLTLANKINFDVVEPYSVNGFLEALHVAAQSAGYPSYNNTNFILKVQFLGYPDNQDIPQIEIIPGTTKYFPIQINTVEIETTRKGTVYKVQSTPKAEMAFAQAGKLIGDISVTGKTLDELGKDFAKKFTNKLLAARNSSTESTASDKNNDSYEILFPVLDSSQISGYNLSEVNKIGKSLAYKEYEDAKNPTFVQPEEVVVVDANGAPIYALPAHQGNRNVKDVTINFTSGQNIQDALTSLVRDSHYTRDIMADPAKFIDDRGFVDYFRIVSQIEEKDGIDPGTRKPYYIYRYLVIPYKIHFTAIPGFGNKKVDPNKLTLLASRVYDYIYTGKNSEVIDFKIALNNLYFEGFAKALGSNDMQQSAETGAKNNEVDKKRSVNQNDLNSDINGVSRAFEDTRANELVTSSGSGSAVQYSPYLALSRNFHTALMETTSEGMIKCDIKIFGDPFYVTVGIGGDNGTEGIGASSKIDFVRQEAMILIRFSNPIDIDASSGFTKFSRYNGYGGIYKITNVTSNFVNGIFTQKLELTRLLGQIDLPIPVYDPANAFISVKNPQDAVTDPPAAMIERRAQIDETLNFSELTGRGLPNPGLPDNNDNFTNATGGLGGTTDNVNQQVAGSATDGLGQQAAASSVYGGSILGGSNQFASGIRMSLAGLVNQSNSVLRNASAIQNASNLISQSLGRRQATLTAIKITNNIISQQSNVVNSNAVQNSGIGVGPSIYVDPQSQIDPNTIYAEQGTLTVADINAQKSAIPTDAISYTGNATGLEDSNFYRVNSIENQAVNTVARFAGGMASVAAISVLQQTGRAITAPLINGIGKTLIGRNYGTRVDPSAIGIQFGINIPRISGLTNSLGSMLTGQLNNLTNNIIGQASFDIQTAISRGLIPSVLNSTNITNIPRPAPYVIAQGPGLDPAAKGYATPATVLNSSRPIDSAIASDKIASASDQVAGVSNTQQSVESQKMVAVSANISADMAKSAISQYGSNSTNNPLNGISV